MGYEKCLEEKGIEPRTFLSQANATNLLATTIVDYFQVSKSALYWMDLTKEQIIKIEVHVLHQIKSALNSLTSAQIFLQACVIFCSSIRGSNDNKAQMKLAL